MPLDVSVKSVTSLFLEVLVEPGVADKRGFCGGRKEEDGFSSALAKKSCLG